MACYHPRYAFRRKEGPDPVTGKWPLVFNPVNGLTDEKSVVPIPCGYCVGCRLEHARQWAVRCIQESKMYKQNCFITLTYSDEHYIERCPNGSLNKDDFQLFMKRLRHECEREIQKIDGKKVIRSAGIRYYHCGEYGGIKGRAHHHAAIFNHRFSDEEYYTTRSGNKFYKSEQLESLWRYGLCDIGELTPESAAYISGYIGKKIMKNQWFVYGKDKKIAPFQTMSRRPGIGKSYVEKYGSTMLQRDSVIIEGLEQKLPRYYTNLFEKINPEKVKLNKIERMKKINKEDNTAKRLKVREEIKVIQLKRKKRSMQNETTNVQFV